jgi:hypothetical protein
MNGTSAKSSFDDMEDYLRRAKEFNKNNGLQGYLVVFQKVDGEGKIEICKETCVFPSFSHIAAMFDNPENGVSILDVKYMGVGRVALKALVQKPVSDLNELQHGITKGI